MMQDGLILAGYHIESGARKFADYSKAMIDELGEAIRPYLRSFYESVRYYPGFDTEGLSTPEEIDSLKPSGKKKMMDRISLETMLRNRIQEESPTLMYHLAKKEGKEGVKALLRMQAEAAEQAYQVALSSGARTDEASEIAMDVLFEYPGKPVEMIDPSLIDRDSLLPERWS